MYAISSSGGKDGTFALFIAEKLGLPVTHLVHVYNIDTSRTRFHGYKYGMIEKQAECLGLKPIILPSRTPTSDFEKDLDFLLEKLKQEKLKGIVFGNLYLEDVREFYETKVKAKGLEYYDVLWKIPTEYVLKAFIKSGFKAIVTSVWANKLNKSYLGRIIDENFLLDIMKEKGIDPCGENGEFHTLVFDGPCFKQPLKYKIYGEHEEKTMYEGEEYHHIYLDIRED